MIINANSLHIPLADSSVNCVVTSPPYYGLRDYGIDAQIGLEVTPDEYIANLVAVFRECKRILRDDGTLWVNIGDSYSGSGNGTGDYREDGASISKSDAKYGTHKPGTPNGLKPKDLIGIPWMLAFALRADGWYLRQDIIWAKPNPMPESVKDRCTKSHEYIFLLSKSAKYYYDNEAIKEDSVYPNDNRKARVKDTAKDFQRDIGNKLYAGSQTYPVRNKRDVWTVTTKPYKGAHYATFNPELIKPCILAGAPETCCAKCGAPYERVVKKTTKYTRPGNTAKYGDDGYKGHETKAGLLYRPETTTETTGYRTTCDCNAGTSSGIVFDPFVGSGTTVATAIQLGRKGIGLDLSLTYLYENAKDRIKAEMLPLLTLIEQE